MFISFEMIHAHIEVKTNRVKDGPSTCRICVAFPTSLPEQEAIEAGGCHRSSCIIINQQKRKRRLISSKVCTRVTLYQMRGTLTSCHPKFTLLVDSHKFLNILNFKLKSSTPWRYLTTILIQVFQPTVL